MPTIEILRLQADNAYEEVLAAISGTTEKQAWTVLPHSGSDYLHTGGSIYSIVLHLASLKFVYGSVAFRNSEIRWRDCADRIDRLEPSWNSATDYLAEAHKYWLASWSGLSEEELEREVLHFSGKTWPAWRIVNMPIHHDSYHAGQIAVLRYAIGESNPPPPPRESEEIRKHCRDLPSW